MICKRMSNYCSTSTLTQVHHKRVKVGVGLSIWQRFVKKARAGPSNFFEVLFVGCDVLVTG